MHLLLVSKLHQSPALFPVSQFPSYILNFSSSSLFTLRSCNLKLVSAFPINSNSSFQFQLKKEKQIGTLLNSMDSKTPPCHPTYDLKGVIKLALSEDSANIGDVTSMATIPAEMEVEAQFLTKEDGIVAGITLAEMIFHEVDPSLKVEWYQKDGDHVHKGLSLGKVYGRAHSIVVAERVALNFMQRMSGIATLTKEMADAAYPATILETRKTAPGLRLVDKWAVLIGGGRNHRLGLFDMVLIKDNHVSIAGGITKALKSTDDYLVQNNLVMEVEVETRTLEEVKEVLEYASQNKTSLTRIMLDNMVIPKPNGGVDVSMLKKAVRMIDGRFETEASGNVTLDTVHQIGQTGVTYISSGALTHSVKALDISLKIDTELALEVGRRTNRA
ncbi:quinolinate phosphoribosyltransferase [decarboxylating] 1a isoform X2 [Amaranthus tricolor]|uniref:quinolinate phosphoribosyltransferase [decarboxylating] 1a isoform X2 n=1 Tax=Amaranthus tricolor TaxID=29722 RepID=UPI00258B8D18|nr:quinolinate phosphoribosyltransferase [decarboxylating] 1a isoform X2 [Amaranthus tricolor]